LHIRDQMLGARLERIEQQETSIKALEQDSVSCHQELAGLKETLADVEREKAVSDERQRVLQASLDERTIRLHRSESYRADQDRVLGKLESALKASEEGRLQKLQEVGDCRNHIQRLEDELSLGNQTIHSLEKSVTSLQSQLQQAHDTLAEKTRDLSSAAEKIAGLGAELAAREQRIVAQEREITALRAQLHVAGESIAEGNRRQSAAEEKIVRLENGGRALLEKLGQRERAMATLETELLRLREMDVLNGQHISRQKQQLEELVAMVAGLESEQVALKAHLVAGQGELDRYRSYRVVKLIDRFRQTK